MRLKREVALRRQAEAALQETKRRWRALLDAAPLGIVLTSREGNVLKANRHMRQMLGLTAREMLSANAAAHYANPASRRELMARLAATGQAVEWEAKLRRKDGAGNLHTGGK